MRMDPPPPDFRLLRFSSENYPSAARLEAWREVIARKLINASVQPLSNDPFYAKVMMRAQHGVRVAGGTIGASLNRLRRSAIAQDHDDVALLVNLNGEIAISLKKREHALRINDAILFNCWEPAEFGWRETTAVSLLRIPRAVLDPLVPSLDEAAGRLIPRETDMLRLLGNYVSTLFADDDFAMTLGASRIVTNHIIDLVALCLGASHQTAVYMAGGGRHAARLRIMKADIVRNLRRADLNAVQLAIAHHLSPRAVQRLFASEGTTLSAFVLEQRLGRAYRLLSDTRFSGRNVSDIAFESGFSDVSYFNRTFLRRFGASPSEIRSRAGIGGGRSGR